MPKIGSKENRGREQEKLRAINVSTGSPGCPCPSHLYSKKTGLISIIIFLLEQKKKEKNTAQKPHI